MKRQILLISILLTVVTSCKKDKKDQDDNYYMKAARNNTDWNASTYWNFIPLNRPDSIEIRGYNNSDRLHIQLNLSNQGGYQINYRQTTYELRTASGATLATYNLSDTLANTIHFIALDTTKHYMTGNFELFFKKATGQSDAPAKINFKNGQFISKQVLAFTL